MSKIKYRQWLGDRFHYWGFLNEGEFVGPAQQNSAYGQDAIHQRFIGLRDIKGQPVYEGDIISVEIDQPVVSPVRLSGVIEVDPDSGIPFIDFPQYGSMIELSSVLESALDAVDGVKVVGNECEHPNWWNGADAKWHKGD